MNKNRTLIVLVLFIPILLSAQIQVSGQLDLVAQDAGADDRSNKTFSGFSNFDGLRFRLFLDSPVNERTSVFVQFLLDNKDLVPYGAYVRFQSLLDRSLNLHVGFIPNTVGIYGPRTYSDKNPLIGTPLIYIYHTALTTRGLFDGVDELHALRANGFEQFGLPILYDACWNSGIELFGTAGKFDWSIAALAGSVTKPSVELSKNRPQLTTRLSYFPVPELTLSISGFFGPYFSTGSRPGDINLNNTGGGISLVLLLARTDINIEAFSSTWETPNFGELGSSGAFLDLKQGLGARMFVAGRIEGMRFTELDYGEVLGVKSWDMPIDKWEAGLGYHIDRNSLVKVVYQNVSSSESAVLDDQFFAAQLSITL